MQLMDTVTNETPNFLDTNGNGKKCLDSVDGCYFFKTYGGGRRS